LNNYDKLTKQIFDLDPKVRFVGVANGKGELVTGGQKDNVEKFLTEEQVKMSIHYALQKKRLYTNLAFKIGHEKASITEFDIVTMISIPTNSDELFLISTEPKANYFKIIDFVHNALDSQNQT
jgi:hypothetical protein